MIGMKNFDHKDLDWHLLHIFLTVLQETNVTRAADRLGLTQSTVSHALKKLRLIFGDPLFVRSGKGIVPTERARSLRDPVTAILDSIKQLSDARPFDPRDAPLEFVIAANDATRDLLFPRLMLDAAQEQIDLRLSFIPSGLPSTKLLNDARCDLIVTPMPPDGPDIIQSKLFEGEMHCYYDATQRDPPRNWDAYRTDRHIAVRFADGRASSELVAHVDSAPIKPPVLTVTNFGSLVPFIKGSTLLATALNHTGLGPLKELDHAPLPFSTDPVSVFLVWHRRDSTDPAHRWLHDRIRQSARALKLQN
jgi:DNA-binding transcriptional LysR family regulator